MPAHNKIISRSHSIVELPPTRHYEQHADERLEDALAEAIEAAEDTDNSYLATVLRQEFGTHYSKNGSE